MVSGAGGQVVDVDSESSSDDIDPAPTLTVAAVAISDQPAHLTTALSGSGIGYGEFEQTFEETEFEVSVQGLAGRRNYPVLVDGVQVGQLITNQFGRGRLSFEIGSDDNQLFPADFPPVNAGSILQVGDSLAGTFAVDFLSNDSDDGRFGSEGDREVERDHRRDSNSDDEDDH